MWPQQMSMLPAQGVRTNPVWRWPGATPAGTVGKACERPLAPFHEVSTSESSVHLFHHQDKDPLSRQAVAWGESQALPQGFGSTNCSLGCPRLGLLTAHFAFLWNYWPFGHVRALPSFCQSSFSVDF